MRAFLLSAVLLLGITSATALDVQLIGEKVSFSANQTPLHDLLAAFAQNGVYVRMDPEIRATVTGTARNESVESVLHQILEPLGYVLIWDVVDGPLGEFPKLAEIQVFQPGRPEKAVPLPPPSENFAVATGPDGRAPRFAPNEILLGFRPGTRRDEFERLIREIGGSVLGCAKDVGVYWIRLPAGANVLDFVEQLKRNPLIAHAEPNYIMDVIAPIAEKPSPQTQRARSSARRAKTVVAVLDSGILALDDFQGAVKLAFDAIRPDRPVTDPIGHGTQMALIAAGVLAPDGALLDESVPHVPIAAIRTLDDYGRTTSFTLMRAIEHALKNGARVINMSWGSPVASEFLEAAVRNAASRGAVIVAAAGNEPTGKPVYPAAYPNVVAVSGATSDGQLWSKSNTGLFVSFSAPAFATFPVGYKGPPGTYTGTSIASAFVAFALAQYFDQHPNASAQDAVEALKASAMDCGPVGRDPQFGYGLVNGEVVKRLLQQ